MNNEYKKRIDEAAKNILTQAVRTEVGESPMLIYMHRMAEFVLDNPPPEIEALVKAFKVVVDDITWIHEESQSYEVLCMNKSYFEYCRSALAAFEKARGGKR